MTTRLQRRSFLTLLGGAAAAWPLAARAQQQRGVPVIGFLDPRSPEPNADRVVAFRKGLSEMGFVEGRNVAIEFRWGHDDLARVSELVADLVQRRVAVIVVPGSDAAALAAKAATATIPIVFSTGTDPVQTGLVASLSRPGGNVTGLTGMGADIAGKTLGLLQELLPGAIRFAALGLRGSAGTETYVADLQAAAARTGRQVEAYYASTTREIDAAFDGIAQRRFDALLVIPYVFFTNRRVQLTTLAAHHRLPAIYSGRQYPEAGGLMSYGSNVLDRERQLGIYAGRVLKGEKPADLPVMRATKFEFVINLQTARTLGIEVPPTLLAITDEVIE